MKDLTDDQLEKLLQKEMKQIIFIYTPFCATCQLAEQMLAYVLKMREDLSFSKMNASFFPEFMHDQKIESVPALIQLQNGEVSHRLYAFESVTNLLEKLDLWQKESIH